MRIAAALDVPCIELDAIHHLAGWVPIDAAVFEARVRQITSTDGWVADGNYREVVTDGPVWQRADTVVWLDLPRRTVTRQIIARTLRRALLRRELWNGNREPWSNLYAWQPERSVVRWSWTQHDRYRQQHRLAMTSPAYAHLTFVRLASHGEVERWSCGLAPVG